jgi:hypothetical protein
MKRLIVMLMVLVFVGVAVAADTYTYESKQGNVNFNHKVHGEKIACKDCHGNATPGKIEVTKDLAHKAVCKDCHAAKGGPTKCGECHKK